MCVCVWLLPSVSLFSSDLGRLFHEVFASAWQRLSNPHPMVTKALSQGREREREREGERERERESESESEIFK